MFDIKHVWKIYNANTNQKKLCVLIVLSDKYNFKATLLNIKRIFNNKKSIKQADIIMHVFYALNNMALKYVTQMLIEEEK